MSISAVRLSLVLSLLGLLGAFAALVLYFHPFLSDDALISLRYAERLATGQGLTWTDGERVEGYSDLLWVLIHALLHWLGFDPIRAVRAVGLLGATAAIFGVCLPQEGGLRAALARTLGGGWVLACSAPLAVWAIGGLEHGFMAGILVGAIYWQLKALGSEGAPTWSALLLSALHYACLALLRLDGALFVGVAALVGAWHGRGRGGLRAACLLALPSAVALAGQLAFRVAYYGQWIPNTARVKLSPGFHRFAQGADHLLQGAGAASVPIAAAILATTWVLLRDRPEPWQRLRFTLPWCLTLSWCAYLAFAGGDIFPGWRQLLLAWVPLALVVAEGAQRAVSRRQLPTLLALSLLATVIGGYLVVQIRDGENQRAKNELWEWQGLPVGDLLQRAFADDRPLLAVDAAGALPFWSKLPSLDLLGLNDAYIASHPPEGFGSGQIGHELGDGDYAWKRAPDLLAFNNATGVRWPSFRSGREMMARSDFLDRYGLMVVRGQRGSQAMGEIWVRKDGALGLRREPGRILIPGYLFSERAPGGAVLGEGDRLVTPIAPGQPVRATHIALEAGRWSLHTRPSHGSLRWGLVCDGQGAARLAEGDGAVVELEQDAVVDLAVELTGSSSIALSSVVLEETTRAPGWRCLPPRQPMRIEESQLRAAVLEGSFWASPGHVVMGKHGVSIVLEKIRYPEVVEISLDDNDRYLVSLLRGDEQVALFPVDGQARGGMAIHRLSMPSNVRGAGIDRLRVVPDRGDGAYSLGHLRLLP